MKITVTLPCLIIFCCFLTGIVCAEVPGYGNWTEITDNASFGPRESYGTTVFDNRLWVIGGNSYGGDNRLLNDVWSSPDGINWTLETGHAEFSPRSGHTVAAFDNRLWVIGGSGTNDVWSSPDGINWTLETEHAGFSPRGYHGSAVFDNRLWVIGGLSSDSPTTFSITDDVWSSPNGINWTLETGHAEFGPRYGLGVAVVDNRLWVIGGSWTNDVWSSPNGINWTQVNPSAPFKQMEFTPVAVSETGFGSSEGDRTRHHWSPKPSRHMIIMRSGHRQMERTGLSKPNMLDSVPVSPRGCGIPKQHLGHRRYRWQWQ